ncbi:host specificity factor TipJ family phage tail protein [Methylobacterium sp. E-045]|uniref:host specificity factor TipJ family phage tail protein n=1 Tax=Methylobacterium sp. E-045 TaxID=2836575 RepID=UPI001FBA71CA|nr:host specificity factor TipJ family phage tail protein [Methylobacterium sp. E-045]MCJ2131453.1 host specificity factor TipJ family phage tail protein [Methylobacterium sp. E-045]
MNAPVRVLAQPHLLDPTRDRVEFTVAPGQTIAQMVAEAMPSGRRLGGAYFRVTLNGHPIADALWHAVKPKPGTQVLIRVVPQGDILRNVLTIALTVAAVAAGQFYGPMLAGELLFGGLGGVGTGSLGTVLSGAITATTLLAGTLLINALIPIRSDKKDTATYGIQGLRNQAQPDGVVPGILGFIRSTPPYGMLPYTESVGDDRFVTALFIHGYGPIALRNHRIGETPLEKYQEVTAEHREGRAGDAALTLTPRQVVERGLTIELLSGGPGAGPQTRYTKADISSFSIDIGFPGGLGGVDKDGKKVGVEATFTLRYRKVGTEPWTVRPISVYAKLSGKPFTRTFPYDVTDRGLYEVEVTRTSADFDRPDQDLSKKEIQRTGRSQWSALRSFRPEYPLNFDTPLAVTAIRIRATGQLNGTLDEYNCDAFCVCPDWDATSKTWIERETQNPASLFRHVLTGPAGAYPLTVDEVDALGGWHAYCVANGLTYNRIHDYEASVLDVLSDIAAAGRASPHDKGDRWGVVIDRALDTVAAHITPRNSWGFKGERAYLTFPDAFRVSFLDETNSFTKADRIVPWPGFVGQPKVIEKLELPGITNPAQVWKEARKRQYEIMLRLDTFTVNQDFESLVPTRGDRVELSHDVLDRDQISARIILKPESLSAIIVDEMLTMEAGQSYAARVRYADGTSNVFPVRTVAGTSNVLILDGPGQLPDMDNLVMFGKATRISQACTVKGIQPQKDFTAALTLIPHAPEIETLVANDVPPAWSGRAGAVVDQPVSIPVAPIIVSVDSGTSASSLATTENPYPVVVNLRPNPSGTTPLATFQVLSRKVGTTTWLTSSALAGAGSVLLAGYAKGDVIEYQARGVSTRGTAGDLTGLATHTVGATDAPSPTGLVVAIERATVNGGTSVAFLRLTCSAPTRTDLSLVGRYRPVGSTTWTAIPLNTSSRTSIASGTLSDATDYEVQGALSTDSGADISNFVAATGSPIRAVSDPAAPNAPTYTSATLSGTTVTHAIKQSGGNARGVQLFRANGFGSTFANAALSTSKAVDPNQTDTLTDTISLGYITWWLTAQNGSGVSSVPSASQSLLYVTQPGAKNSFPNDLTNAEWIKTATTAALNGTGPDGAAATMIAETATTGTHTVAYKATGLASGSKVRAVWGLKASGRSAGRIDLINSGGTGNGDYVRTTFDLTAGTISVGTPSGTTFSGVTATIQKVSADFWLIVITATTSASAGTSGALAVEDRLNLGTGGTTISYAGDTTKGLLAWACSLAPVP